MPIYDDIVQAHALLSALALLGSLSMQELAELKQAADRLIEAAEGWRETVQDHLGGRVAWKS